jgi:hypothetical protein
MSDVRIQCLCGEKLFFEDASREFDGVYIQNSALQGALAQIGRDALDFGKAIAAGRRTEWIFEYFAQYGQPELSDDEILEDMALSHLTFVERAVLQCPKCSRLYLETAPESFKYDTWRSDGSLVD